ncbi:putative uncharacterized protein DDB_G0290521 isoform X2 [Penaeus chinensis]|nr:putative uncharacterized protein DDB_G0290521 isoform X2 [Penaeus chinensis]XP_047468579.1 putative uncharacterized protein DDB_G0290521 isoform X2 [Penaeus chinensis]
MTTPTSTPETTPTSTPETTPTSTPETTPPTPTVPPTTTPTSTPISPTITPETTPPSTPTITPITPTKPTQRPRSTTSPSWEGAWSALGGAWSASLPQAVGSSTSWEETPTDPPRPRTHPKGLRDGSVGRPVGKKKLHLSSSSSFPEGLRGMACAPRPVPGSP